MTRLLALVIVGAHELHPLLIFQEDLLKGVAFVFRPEVHHSILQVVDGQMRQVGNFLSALALDFGQSLSKVHLVELRNPTNGGVLDPRSSQVDPVDPDGKVPEIELGLMSLCL